MEGTSATSKDYGRRKHKKTPRESSSNVLTFNQYFKQEEHFKRLLEIRDAEINAQNAQIDNLKLELKNTYFRLDVTLQKQQELFKKVEEASKFDRYYPKKNEIIVQTEESDVDNSEANYNPNIPLPKDLQGVIGINRFIEHLNKRIYEKDIRNLISHEYIMFIRKNALGISTSVNHSQSQHSSGVELERKSKIFDVRKSHTGGSDK